MAHTHVFELHRTIASLDRAQKQQLIQSIVSSIGLELVLQACARGMNVSDRSVMMTNAQEISAKSRSTVKQTVKARSLDNLAIPLIAQIGSHLRLKEYFALGRVNKTTYIACNKRPTLVVARYRMRRMPRSYSIVQMHRHSSIEELTVNVESFNKYERELDPNHNVRLNRLRRLTLCLTGRPGHAIDLGCDENLQQFLRTDIIDLSLIERLTLVKERNDPERDERYLQIADFERLTRAFRNVQFLNIMDVNIFRLNYDVEPHKLRFEHLQSLIVDVVQPDRWRWLCPFLDANRGSLRRLVVFGFPEMAMAVDINQMPHSLDSLEELIINGFEEDDNMQAIVRKAPNLQKLELSSIETDRDLFWKPTVFIELFEPFHKEFTLVIPWNGYHYFEHIADGAEHRRASTGAQLNLMMKIDVRMNEKRTMRFLDKLKPLLHRIGDIAGFRFILLVFPWVGYNGNAFVSRIKPMIPSSVDLKLTLFRGSSTSKFMVTFFQRTLKKQSAITEHLK